jgi:hypothetical protein
MDFGGHQVSDRDGATLHIGAFENYVAANSSLSQKCNITILVDLCATKETHNP